MWRGVRRLRFITMVTAMTAALLWVHAEGKGKLIERTIVDSMPGVSMVVSGYEREDSVITRLSQRPLHSVEGLWRLPAEGSLMAIEQVPDYETPDIRATLYRIVVVAAANPALRPGTLLGWLTPTAKRGVYDARIFTAARPDGVTLHKPKTYTVTLTESDSRLEISAYGVKMRFNWWRLLPYMYRYLVTRQEKSPGNIHGCVRVYPAPEIPLEPRYL